MYTGGKSKRIITTTGEERAEDEVRVFTTAAVAVAARASIKGAIMLAIEEAAPITMSPIRMVGIAAEVRACIEVKASVDDERIFPTASGSIRKRKCSIQPRDLIGICHHAPAAIAVV